MNWRATAGILTLIMAASLASGNDLPTRPTQSNDRHWDGFNPFEAPSRTTDFYGSGDIDLDGRITTNDLSLLNDMIQNKRSACVRADVNGDGKIDSADLDLLTKAVQGSALPGWWNCLATASDRVLWIQRTTELDFNQLLHNGEARADWDCFDYATRSFLRFAPQLFDPANPDYAPYGIAQCTFNLPVYVVAIYSCSSGFGHSINAILIGEDPRQFTNWYFFEPQTGKRIQPDDANNMPWGTEVDIQRPNPLNAPYQTYSILVSFQLIKPVPVLDNCDPNLLIRRPTPDPTPVHNNPNLWHPVFVSASNGMFLFDKSREDMGRTTDLHLLKSMNGDPNTAQPLCNSTNFSRLVYTAAAEGQNFHLLWVEQTNRLECLCYGKLDALAGEIRERKIIATNIFSGQVLGIGTNEVYVFYTNDLGIACLPRRGTNWGGEETVATWTTFADKSAWPCFAVATNSAQDPVVIWANESATNQTTIFETQRHGTWGASTEIVTVKGYIPNLSVAADSLGTVHLVYANTSLPQNTCWSSNLPQELWQVVRGSIYYLARASMGWTPPQRVACKSFWPSICVTKEDHVFLAWETDTNGLAVPVWTDTTNQTIPQAVFTDATPYYPTPAEKPDGSVTLVWSTMSNLGCGLGYREIQEKETMTLAIAKVGGWLRISWKARSGGSFQIEYKDALRDGAWQSLGGGVVTETGCGTMCVLPDDAASCRLYRVRRI